MKDLYKNIYQQIRGGNSFALATILSHKGSTPRTSGTRMMVFPDKTIRGTIGGGRIEAEVITACAGMLAPDASPKSVIKTFILNSDLKSGLDMVCGGELQVWIETYTPASDSGEVFSNLAGLEKSGGSGVLVSRLMPGGNMPATEKTVIPDNGEIPGNSGLPRDLTEKIKAKTFTQITRLEIEGESFIVEPLLPGNAIYIFGGGHVGYSLANMAHLIDLPCVVVDDREEFANGERFPHARAVHVVDRFDTPLDTFGVNENAYIVILTRGHLHDETVLEQALKTPAPYIGMIGSRRKRDIIYANLMARGVERSRLDEVHSPIGIEINSETPAEIAVSILAQIIQTKGAANRKQFIFK
ncbi:MAG: XdhC family protein [Desulfobacterales bacterium]|nr:XdhC family protein [Desulfobacterales bacterium]